jgi:N-acetylmuramoyl-L-alanine amidase
MLVRALGSITAVMLAAPTIASAAFVHVVAPGESLSSVAASDGLTVEQLAAANGLSPETPLLAGSDLVIPAQGETQAPGAEPSPTVEAQTPAPAAEADAGAYVVQPGDTLSQIAARSGTSVEALAAHNGIDPNAPLPAGSTLQLSGAASEAAPEEAAQTSAGQTSAAAAPQATGETVSPAEVGSIAAEYGVPPSLAEAIAEQESGFNNGVTSSADARGVMQILPGTWSWINQNLATQPTLAPDSAASNVRGGVLYLQWLLDETGGDPGLAAAGYYQGLESVRQEGETPETEQYVSSVLALDRRFSGG